MVIRSFHPLATPTVDQQTAATRTWTAAGRTSRTLVVIDLSGSMGASIGGGQTKIQFAAQAELAAIKFFPDSSSLGLWGFSVNRTGTTDWSNLVPLGPLDGKVGNTTRRARARHRRAQDALDHVRRHRALRHDAGGIRVGAQRLRPGQRQLRRAGHRRREHRHPGYQPGKPAQPVAQRDAIRSRPLPIITIAVGKDADVATLRKISAATGGTTYTAAGPDDIRNAFLDAIIKAG